MNTEPSSHREAVRLMLAVAVGGILSASAIMNLSVMTRYPFHFIWDMDSIVVQDTILAESGHAPDQILHPSVGMYLVTTWLARWGRLLGFGWTTRIGDLEHSLHPLACVAELTDIFRSLSTLMIVVILLLSWLLVLQLARPHSGIAVAALGLLALQPSWLYHATMIRSELYAVLYWAAGFLIAAAASTVSDPRLRSASIVLAGTLLGMAFLTKVQAIGHVLCAAAMVAWAGWGRVAASSPSTGAGRRVGALTAFGVAVFLALTLRIALKTEIPAGVPTWTESFGLTLQALMAVVVPLVLATAQLSRVPRRVAETARDLTLLSVGGLMALGSSLLVPSNLGTAARYALNVVKMVFLRPAGGDGVFDRSLSDGFAILAVRPCLLLALGGLALGVLQARRAGLRLRDQQTVILGMAIAGVAILEAFLVVRPIQRDQLWIDSLLPLGLLVGGIALHRGTTYRGRHVVLSVLLMLLAIDGIDRSQHVRTDLEALLADYGWRPTHAILAAYQGRQPMVEDAVLSAYSNAMSPEFRWWLPPPVVRSAVNHRAARLTAQFVVPNRRVEQRHLGVLWEGLISSSENPDARLLSVPEILRGSLVIDVEAARPLGRGRRNPESFGREWMVSEATEPADPRILVLLPRSDLDVYVFEGSTPTPPSADVQGNKLTIIEGSQLGRRLLFGRLITTYSELPPLTPEGRRLVVVVAPAIL